LCILSGFLNNGLAVLIFDPSRVSLTLLIPNAERYPLLNCRFPPPWSVEELEACFVVNQRAKLGYFYYGSPAIGGHADRLALARLSLSIVFCRTLLGG
jgi:hypothetical protein